MRWFRALFRKDLLDKQLDKEISFHIEQQTMDNVANGKSEDQARREAIEPDRRGLRGVQFIESVLQDVRFGMRTLVKDRGYTVAAIVALALGIGVNTALFTVFNSIVLRPLPVPDPSKVVSAYRTTPQLPFPGPFSFSDYVYYRDHNSSFTAMAALFPAHLRMSGASLPVSTPSGGLSSFAGVSAPEQLPGVAEPVMGLFISGTYFSVMQVNPVLGRSLLSGDDISSGPPYAVLLSENFWQRRFGRDPGVLGKNLMFSGISTTVVGITPRDFMGTRPQVPDVWLPLAAQQDPGRRVQDRNTLCCEIEARLRNGVALQQAKAEMSVLTNALHQQYPDTDQRAVVNVEQAEPFGTEAHRGYQQLFYIALQPAISLVLLIACTNVAGLLLGRAMSRQREIAVRLALGAGRWRLVRQLVTEGVLIAQFAAGVSLLLTWWTLHVLVKALSSSMVNSGLSDGGTIFLNVTPDARVFVYTFCVALLTGVGFALAPALQATKPNLRSVLNEGAAFGSGKKSRFRGWMVAIQISVCLMLLIGAGMLVRSSLRLLSTDPGFETRTVLDVSILNPGEIGYPVSRTEELRRLLKERLRALPGVKSIASTSRVPLGGNVQNTVVVPYGSAEAHDTRANGRAAQFPYSLISPEYFETLGIALLRGRSFTAQEIANRAQVVVVSNALARRLWPGEEALGKRVAIGSPSQTHFQFQQGLFSESSEVIGVVRDVHSVTPIIPDPGAIYLPQRIDQWEGRLLVRTEGDPRRVAVALVSEVQSIDRSLSVSFQTLDKTMTSEAIFVGTRLGGVLFAVIGLLGLVLSSVGIYSMVGYTISQQTREIGIRIALGAQRSNVLRLVLGRNIQPIMVGIGAGLILGIILSRVLSALFQGLRVLDAVVLLIASLLLMAIALVAAYVPARKAAKLDPGTTLRFE
jgi:macrolide transport system ATP-binding/permease protein